MTGRLFGQYVDAGGIEFSLGEGIGKGLFVDERTAAGVDDDGGRPDAVALSDGDG